MILKPVSVRSKKETENKHTKKKKNKIWLSTTKKLSHGVVTWLEYIEIYF